jgi:hypothetical protein
MPTPAPPTHPALGLNAAPSNQRKHVGLREREPFELLTLDRPPQGNHQLRDAWTRETVERDAETSGRTHPRGASYSRYSISRLSRPPWSGYSEPTNPTICIRSAIPPDTLVDRPPTAPIPIHGTV